jgi:predicted metal-dependent HD superfamily phosphohydrolase
MDPIVPRGAKDCFDRGVRLDHRWPLPDGEELRDELIAAYADPARSYHDRLHLSEVLDRLDELERAGAPFPAVTVRLAAWFHDAVYDGEPEDEERSARWAETALVGLVDPHTVGEVARLVRMTATHHPSEADPAGAALSDADLAILAAAPERYARYVLTVRREYAQVPDDAFAAGRAAVLRGLMSKEFLFHTSHARSRWEGAARANIAAELERLTA